MKHSKIMLLILVCTVFIPSLPAASIAQTTGDRFHLAEACYERLKEDSLRQKYRHNWLMCIDKFYDVYRLDPSGTWAAAGLYQAATVYAELYSRSLNISDKQEAIDIYHRIMKRFPKSAYSQKASLAIETLTSAKGDTKQEWEAVKDKAIKKGVVRSGKDEGGKGRASVTGIRFWSNPTYTRVVIDLSEEANYNYNLLERDPSVNKPRRLYVDLEKTRLEKDITNVVPIHDNLLSEVRAGQHLQDLVRVVVDIKSFEKYKIFSLKNPFRIVIDVWGEAALPVAEKEQKDIQKEEKAPKGSLAKQLALGVSRIVIDAGHGGRDFGAPGYIEGVYEKDVVLDISKRLAKKVQKELNLEVILTRDNDRYLTLEERTAIANTKNADLFVSIHTNASRDHRAYGLETYFLNLATDDEAILVAARENATSTKNISDLQKILFDLMHNSKVNESSRMAGYVQHSLVEQMNQYYRRIKDKGVKQAPFYVLLGAQMPAILVETSFISNARECQRLTDSQYQDRLCDAIVKGIEEYIRELH